MCDMSGAMGAGMALLWTVAVAVLVVGAVAAARLMKRQQLADRERPAVNGPMDEAQLELRRRYAAGEVGREDYLQRKIDLET